MRIFISHATKNKEIVLKFGELLENISSDIEVFCSSESESIKVGKNFVEYIFDELNNCDIFIPIITKEYYESRFCMIELGVAYSYLYNKYITTAIKNRCFFSSRSLVYISIFYA